ncbi:MAG TPA: pectinesterase family protein [Bryobacteraceae bacterium]|nr:pectinesterase family protein [Bryobacteraceae bacterium]
MRNALSVLLLFGCLSCAQESQPDLKACFVLNANPHSTSIDPADTQRIQNALDLCSPGMAVVLTGADDKRAFQSAPLVLPRGVTLYVDRGVTLFASRNRTDYDIAGQRCDPAATGKIPTCKPFIFSYQAANSGIDGTGIIDGRGCPILVSDYESQEFHIAHITLRNATSALAAIYKTTNLSISDVTLLSDRNRPTAAGILLSNVVHAQIHDAAIRVQGNAILVEPSILGPTSQLDIRNIAVYGGGDVATDVAQKVTVENIVQRDSDAEISLSKSDAPVDLTSGLHFGLNRSLVAAQDGSGNFTTVQQAIDALPAGGGDVLVKPGIYREVVTIRKPHVHLHGDSSADPSKTVIVFNNAGPTHDGTFNSSTVFVEADDATLDYLTIANDAGPHAGQAVALSVTADRATFRNMRILGAQDTLFAASRRCYSDYGPCIPTRQYFADTYIEGGVDFIFGDSKAVFERCELHGISTGNVMFTAQSKHTADQDSGYVFKGCKLTGDKRSPGVMALGRAWRPYATVVFLNAQIDAPVLPAGWVDWPRFGVSTLPTAFFAEYRSTGPGASPPTREPYSHQLTPEEAAKWSSPAFLAGTDGWNPSQFVK